MAPTIEKIAAITLRVLNMKASVQLYRNVLGMELLYGGVSLHCGRAIQNLRSLTSNKVTVSRSGAGWSFTLRMLMRSGFILKRRDSILKCHGTRLGVNAIFTCSIRMATSCRLLGRYAEPAKRTKRMC